MGFCSNKIIDKTLRLIKDRYGRCRSRWREGEEMGKRGNGEGSISRRSIGGWMGQYVVHTADGRKRRTVY